MSRRRKGRHAQDMTVRCEWCCASLVREDQDDLDVTFRCLGCGDLTLVFPERVREVVALPGMPSGWVWA